MLNKLKPEYYKPVLTKLYNLINLQKIKYQIINQKNHLDELTKSKYYISAHFQGNNFLFFMCIINNKKLNVLISKKELKYYLEQNNEKDLKLYTIDCEIDDIFYNNTLLDGKMISDKNIYNIHEVYYLEGKNVQNINLRNKLDNLNNLLNKIKIKDNITFKICKLYDYNELPDLLFNKLKISELKINGIIFLPEFSNKYYIYTNDQEFELLKNNNYIKPSNNTNTNSNNEFLMKKTNLPDVYELFNDSDKKSCGIAHIPNIKTSHYFRTIFKDKNTIKVNCIRSEKIKKWIPLCDDYLDYSDIIF